MFEDLPGTVVDLGGGCGTYGGPSNTWSHIEARSLVAGGYAHFYAYGPPLQLAIAAFGIGTPVGVPLSSIGFPSPPNCELHLAVLDTLVPTLLIPDSNPALISRGGRADFEFKLPGLPTTLGAQMTTQWLEVEPADDEQRAAVDRRQRTAYARHGAARGRSERSRRQPDRAPRARAALRTPVGSRSARQVSTVRFVPAPY